MSNKVCIASCLAAVSPGDVEDAPIFCLDGEWHLQDCECDSRDGFTVADYRCTTVVEEALNERRRHIRRSNNDK